MKIAVLGAQGTGKTQLVQALRQVLPSHYQLSDGTALMTAIYSDLLNHDVAQYADALVQLRGFDLTLVMGLDLAQPPADRQHQVCLSRGQVDARLRDVLDRQGVNYAVVYGLETARNDCARRAITHHTGQPVLAQRPARPQWQWSCEKCSDAGCEQRMFTVRLTIGTHLGQV